MSLAQVSLLIRDDDEALVREPKARPYGTVAMFQDLYGNLWDLLQPH